MNKQMRRKALAGAFTQKVHEGAVMIVDMIAPEEISTKAFAAMLASLGTEGRTLLLLGSDEARDQNIYKSGRNIPHLIMRESPHINARDVIWAQSLVITQAGLQALSERGSADAQE
jgi:large subunit ribosomal protein L4